MEWTLNPAKSLCMMPLVAAHILQALFLRDFGIMYLARIAGFRAAAAKNDMLSFLYVKKEDV